MRGAPGAGGRLRPELRVPVGGLSGAGVRPRPAAGCPVGHPLGLLHPSGLSWGRGCLSRVSEPLHLQLRTHVCTHARTHTHRYTPGNTAQTCVHTPRYTPPCTHVHRDVHTWKGVHTYDTGQRGDRAGHLQGSRDTAAHRRPATTKGDGVPSRTCGEQGSETAENIRESHMGGPHAGRGCLTSPGPAEEPTQQLLGWFCPSEAVPGPRRPHPHTWARDRILCTWEFVPVQQNVPQTNRESTRASVCLLPPSTFAKF